MVYILLINIFFLFQHRKINALGIPGEDILSSDDDLPDLLPPRKKRKMTPPKRDEFVSDNKDLAPNKEEPDCYIVIAPQDEPIPQKMVKKEEDVIVIN